MRSNNKILWLTSTIWLLRKLKFRSFPWLCDYMELTKDDIGLILLRGSRTKKKWLWRVKEIIDNDNYVFNGIVSGMSLIDAMKMIDSKSILIGRWTVKQLLFLVTDTQQGYDVLDRYWFSGDSELLQLELFQDNEAILYDFPSNLDDSNLARVEKYDLLFDGARKYSQE